MVRRVVVASRAIVGIRRAPRRRAAVDIHIASVTQLREGRPMGHSAASIVEPVMRRCRWFGLSAPLLLIFGCSSGSASWSGEAGAGDGGTEAAVVNECPTPSGGPTEHTNSIGTETWTAAGSPHVVSDDTSVTGTLTVEPCAEILIGATKTITVRP